MKNLMDDKFEQIEEVMGFSKLIQDRLDDLMDKFARSPAAEAYLLQVQAMTAEVAEHFLDNLDEETAEFCEIMLDDAPEEPEFEPYRKALANIEGRRQPE